MISLVHLLALLVAHSSGFSDRLATYLAIANLQRFPSRAECQEWVECADRHLEWIDRESLLYPQDRAEWAYYRQQVVEWRVVWDVLRICQIKPQIAADWQRLRFIRAALGEWRYRAGYVPPPVAPWYIKDYCFCP